MEVYSKQKKTFSAYKEPVIELGDLLEFQKKSYQQFLDKDLKKLFNNFFPIVDSNERFSLEFVSYSFGEPKLTSKEALNNFADYTVPLKVRFRLVNKVTGTKKEEEVIFSELPAMTDQASFVIKGIERTIVSQIIKASGVRFYETVKARGKKVFNAEISPVQGKGVWLAFETDLKGNMFVRIDNGTRKLPISTFLRIIGPQTQAAVLRLFEDDENAHKVVRSTFASDKSHIMDEVYLTTYKVLRGTDAVTVEKAKEVIELKIDLAKFDLSKTGKFNFNKRFNLPVDNATLETKGLTLEDIIFIIKEVVRLNNTINAEADDIDHLGNRRVRPVGELLESEVKKGFARMKRHTRERMITVDPNNLVNPTDIINLMIFRKNIRSFFAQNELSQITHQCNILDELEHFRTVSAIGRGGVSRTHASLEVRDVHPSHYARICPVHTPEGPSVGLVLHLALYARLNENGLLEAPYQIVKDKKLTGEIIYLTALEEEKHFIAPYVVNIKDQKLSDEYVQVRNDGDSKFVSSDKVDMIEIATGEILSIATSLVPFACNSVVVRALYGSNMQRQAVACLNPEAPLVATGYEGKFAIATGRLLLAEAPSEVIEVDSKHIVLKTPKGNKRYDLEKKYTSIHQTPIVKLGQKLKKGDILADVACTEGGQLALGKNLRVAFACYNGGNYEDAILISQRLVNNDTFTSVKVIEHVTEVQETKLGEESITADIPNVSEHQLRNLDSEGIVMVGSEVKPNDILVGKITPRGESHLSPEERLLQSIFGEKAKEIRDTSLKLPPGNKGRVIAVRTRSREDGHELKAGVIKEVRVKVAELRTIKEGDKLANRHGNKGVISKVLPIEDMPFTEDGEPVDILLSPLGVPSRENIGQILELHLGLAAYTLDYQAIVPPLTTLSEKELSDELKEAGFSETGKVALYNGQTGEKFAGNVSVGWMYMLKLNHMIDDKIHARSIGKYSIVSRQPLGGRSRFGGQRLGEMEVWALLGHGAAYTLREMLTIKSDDERGRTSAYNAIIRNEPILQIGTPAAFNVLLYFLRGLGLNPVFQGSEEVEIDKLSRKKIKR